MVSDGIYYLSESHGASLRHECSLQLNINQLKQAQIGLSDKYVRFDNEYANRKFDGLVERLQEMPKEWVLVQITRPFDPSERWTARLQKSVTRRSRLHIVRYQCGANFTKPCHVSVPEPRGTDSNTASIFELLHDATVVQNTEIARKIKDVKNKRQEISRNIKFAVQEVVTGWLREWSCLFVGHLCDSNVAKSIKESIDIIFKQYRKLRIPEEIQILIHHIANGCVYLSKEDIERAVTQIISSTALCEKLINEINEIRSNSPNLILSKRHPIILILDEKLECIPWEMISPLRRHPVSRVPSVHFIHALFKEYEKSIVNGNLVMQSSGKGFYIINPDRSIVITEKRITEFVNKRFPQWQGVCGKEPTKREFTEALTNNEVLLYCGHGNGTQYLAGGEICVLRVKAIPLLFGCSSVRTMDLGGRVSFVGLSQKYLLAGCPSVIGMLWSVTNNDTDNITLSLLNYWFPGEPLNLAEFAHAESNFEVNATQSNNIHEPELLRAIKSARESALMFSNKSALVAFGIPVIIKSIKQ